MARRPPPARPNDEFKRKTLCDVCNRRRNDGKHDDCSKIRQAKYEAEKCKK